ncbi:phage portal protein [Vineibacter terrae]|uniref:phage portal protein n=1 Tax=Vineibacter terrae TaxID=2586908 RepID=UPI002E305D1A|nr:phage portal protein [Vineibacter terrae]HEX2888351.1 phage portal protein [Vineibacter terrae]
MSALVAADGVTPLRASSFRANSSYRGADRLSQELGNWLPSLTSPGGELHWERDALVARARDIERNNGYARGIKHTLLEGVIGANWRLSAKPNWRALGIDYKTAIAWSTITEAKFRVYADDPGCWIDAGRRLRFGGLLRAQFATWFTTGEHLGLMVWLPERMKLGRARYATAVQIVDPDRLSNPSGAPETPELRSGVALGEHNEAVGYWIRDGHPADTAAAHLSYQWTYVPRETEWGRPIVLHGFDCERDGQVRAATPLAAVIETLRMQDVYERGEAAAAILNAIFAAVLETPLANDPELAEQQLGAVRKADESGEERVELRLGGVRVPQLPTGTNLKFLNAARPAAPAFAQFEEAVLRRVAAGMGLSYEQVARDYSKTNYSSARAALLESWKMLTGRSEFMASSFADHVYACWLEEAIDREEIELPAGAPDFYEARAEWTACRWIGPGRGAIDPTKERQASQMAIDTGLSTMEDEAAAEGKDWLENAEQRAYERAVYADLGLGPDAGQAVYRVNTTQSDAAAAAGA